MHSGSEAAAGLDPYGERIKPPIDIQDGDDWVVVMLGDRRLHGDHQVSSRDLADILRALGYDAKVRFGEFKDGDDTQFEEYER